MSDGHQPHGGGHEAMPEGEEQAPPGTRTMAVVRWALRRANQVVGVELNKTYLVPIVVWAAVVFPAILGGCAPAPAGKRRKP